MKLKIAILAGIALFAAVHTSAVDIKTHTVYRIESAGTPGQAITLSASGQGAVSAAANAADPKQQWYITASDDNASAYYLQNVASGGYLKSSKQTSASWFVSSADTPDDATMLMTVTDYNGHAIIRAKSDNSSYGYAHKDAANNIVCWEAAAVNTQWNFVEVPLSQEELDEIQRNIREKADEMAKTGLYQLHLDNLFEDKACTRLKISGELAGNPFYETLPQTLKTMADKVKSGNWAETDGDWDTPHALKYRVQLYEPYSEGAAAAGLAGIQAYTNMNNPTGILANSGELLYILVDDPVPDGATLYLGAVPDEQMYNSVTGGVELHQGLNAVRCYGDNTHYFVYYTVNTVQNGAPVRKVTDYRPLKIHIEGGRLNGFFNYVGDSLYTPDTRADFLYTSQRATHIMYDLVGKYTILHFFLNDMPSKPGAATLEKGVKSSLDPDLNPGSDREHDPVKIMQAWDNMCFSERILMGLQNDADIADPYNQGYYSSIVDDHHQVGSYKTDPGYHYSDYFNNRMMGISQQGDLYMNATSWRTAYNASTISYVLTQFYHDGLWGPAHEYGHMNQGPINMAGTTEVSNNIFSNVALYFSDRSTTSRSDYITSELANFYQNKPFLEYGGSGATRMYWQLWCYYHATRHNTKFYPRLYELLRRNPLKKTTEPGIHYMRDDQLHFAKMCCIAAEEDLTDFFTAWGFFVPLNNYHIDDYSQYNAVLTREDIDAFKKEIASYNFKPNRAIILIDDRPGSTKPSEDGYPKENAGELGGLADFTDGAIPSGNFSYTLDGNTVTVTVDGTDGAGYLIVDEEGNLCGFSNSHTFDVSPEVAAGLMDGTLTLEAVGTDNTTVPATNPVLDGTPDQKRELLQTLIANCDSLLACCDPTETRVGYLYPDACDPLIKACSEARKTLESATATSEALTETLLNLSAEYNALVSSETARIPVIPGAVYYLTNHLYPGYALSSNGQNATSDPVAGNTTVPFVRQWIFRETAANTWTIQNLDNRRYIGANMSYNNPLPMTDTPQNFTIVPLSGHTGYFALAPDNRTAMGIHRASNGDIVHWTTEADASQWTLTRLHEADYVTQRDKLSNMTEWAGQLLDRAGTTEPVAAYKMALTENCLYSNATYHGGNVDDFTSYNVLIDNNVDTYFHSRYNNQNSDDGLDHYIRIEAPGNETFRHFNLTYITRNAEGASTNITAYKIDGSADGTLWTDICSASSGLQTGAAKTNSTGEVTAPRGTRYIRFMVTRSGGTACNHPFFALAELSVTNRTDDARYTPAAEYPALESADMAAVAGKILDSREALHSPSTTLDELRQQYDELFSAYTALLMKMSGATSIDPTEAGSTDPVEYYNLQGVPVFNPEHGIYIRRQGKTITKTPVK